MAKQKFDAGECQRQERYPSGSGEIGESTAKPLDCDGIYTDGRDISVIKPYDGTFSPGSTTRNEFVHVAAPKKGVE
jgi:hypothetical protein